MKFVDLTDVDKTKAAREILFKWKNEDEFGGALKVYLDNLSRT